MTRMMSTTVAAAAFAAAALSPAIADAAFNGWTTHPASQKAGPAEFYPTIGRLPGGVKVRIFGCVRGISYCDVAWRGNRGWVRGNALAGFYKNRRVPLASFGLQLGVPYITFNFGYWDDHYRGKPFFKDRGKWDKDWKKSYGKNDMQDEKPVTMSTSDNGPKSGKDWKKVDEDKNAMGEMPEKKAEAPHKGPRKNDDCKPGDRSEDCRPVM